MCLENVIKTLIIGSEAQCLPQRLRFLCIVQSTAVASPFMKDDYQYVKLSTTQASVALCGVLAALGCLGFATVMFYRQNKKLDKEVCKVHFKMKTLSKTQQFISFVLIVFRSEHDKQIFVVKIIW